MYKDFSKFGSISKTEIVVDPFSKLSRGFGFVYFKEAESSQNAIREMHENIYHGDKITVQIAKRSRPRNKTPGKYLGPKINTKRFGGPGRLINKIWRTTKLWKR